MKKSERSTVNKGASWEVIESLVGAMSRFLHHTIFQVAILTVSGCAFTPEYPEDWSPLVKSTEAGIGSCPDISGTYDDRATQHTSSCESRCSRSLYNILYWAKSEQTFPSQAIKFNPVKISQPSEKIIAVSTEVEISEFVLDSNKGQFSCSDGVVNLRPRYDSGGHMSLGIAKNGYSLFRSKDLSLVAKQRDSFVGLLGPIPGASTIHDWFLWERKE